MYRLEKTSCCQTDSGKEQNSDVTGLTDDRALNAANCRRVCTNVLQCTATGCLSYTYIEHSEIPVSAVRLNMRHRVGVGLNYRGCMS